MLQAARRPLLGWVFMGHNAVVVGIFIGRITQIGGYRMAHKRVGVYGLQVKKNEKTLSCCTQCILTLREFRRYCVHSSQSRIWCHKSLRLAFIDHSSNIEQISFIGPCKSLLNEVSNVTHTCQIFINHIFLQTSYTLRYKLLLHPKTRVIYHRFANAIPLGKWNLMVRFINKSKR
jgi:hypothetical protein